MSKITQTEIDLYNFDEILEDLVFDIAPGAKDWMITNKVVLIFCFLLGIKIDLVLKLKWSDILVLGSENDAIVKNELTIRKYSIPINHKIKHQLSENFKKLGFPDTKELISSKIYYKEGMPFSSKEFIIRNGSIGGINWVYDDLYKGIDIPNYPRVVFGRRVFSVNGYSNDICKKLKQHFEMRLNSELFQFLGYNSKDDISYNLSDINICKGMYKNQLGVYVLKFTQNCVDLKDKNFNGDYPFQKFSAFTNFLLGGNNFYTRPVTNSIRLLLLMSLFSGIRPSKLIELKWKDLVLDDYNDGELKIKSNFLFSGYNLTVIEPIINKMCHHLFLHLNNNEEGEFQYYRNSIRYIKSPNLDKFVFVSNKYNQLTQPSLFREITKALKYWKFPHWDKYTFKSTQIMYGRKLIEIKGDHPQTIKKLKQLFNFKSKKELFEFLYIDYDIKSDNYEFKGKRRNPLFEEILYDV